MTRLAGGGGNAPGILVVVDDQPTREIARIALEGAAGPLDFVRGAEEARAALRTSSYGLVVLDIVLPDADGRSLLIELTRGEAGVSAPIVVLSGADSAAQEAECLGWGAHAFLRKPVDPEELAAAGTSALRRGGSRTAAAERLPGPDALRGAFRALMDAGGKGGGPLTAILLWVGPPSGHSRAAGEPAAPSEAADPVVAALRPRLRDGDVLGRLGASELVLLLPDRDPEEAARLLEGLDEGVRVGIAPAEPGAFFEDVLSVADRDLHGVRERRRERPEEGAPSRRRVVLVEDDPVTAGLVHHRLERSGFAVEHHGNGIAALEAIRRHPPHLAVLDIRLPGMSGFEILARMRDAAELGDVPVLVLTSMGSEADVSRGFELGADDFLVKPFSPTELVARSLRLIRR